MGIALRSWPGRVPGLAQRALPVVLAGLAVLPPLTLLGLPRTLADVGPPQSGIVLIAALLLAPALVGLALALNGLAPAIARCAAPADGEHRQAVLRLLFGLAAFVWVLPLAPAAPALVVAALALVAAWLFLLHLVLAPAPLGLRRQLALLADTGFLCAFLHAGGAATAAWYPAYLALALDNGWRFGVGALRRAAALAVGGFVLVAASTPFWWQYPGLAAGLAVALAGVPALAARSLRSVAAVRAAAAAAGAAHSRLLVALAEALAPLLRRAEDNASPALAVEAEALLPPIEALHDLAAETGPAAAGEESFDLYALVNDAVAGLHDAAIGRGVGIGVRLDPRLPPLVSGRPRLLHRLLSLLLGEAVRRAEAGKVRLGVDAVGHAGRAVRVRFTLREPEGGRGVGFGMLVADELAGLLQARLVLEDAPQKAGIIAVELTLAAAAGEPAGAVDLRQLPVLIAGHDAEFARAVAARVAAWGGAARWIGGFESAAAALAEAIEPCLVLILDGRADVLQALSLAERAAAARPQQPPFVVFVAEPPWVDSLVNLADSDLAAILPAPVTDRLLQNALRALPRQPQDPAAFATAGGAPLRPLTILVAEDDAANRAVIERVLVLAGHRVQLARNGEEALAALEHGGIDLVLMDIGMPRISGYEAARLYRMMRARPPIIALTGDASIETERLCREAGMDAVLTKPIEPDRLIAAVAAAIGAEAPAKPATVVTSITAHPRFAGDSPTPIDTGKVAALRSLGGSSDFLRDVVEAFRNDSREILDDIARAAAACDAAGFRDGAHALRSCAANIGGVRLVELLQSMPAPSARELRQQGAAFVQQLGAELSKLEAALLDCLIETEASRPAR